MSTVVEFESKGLAEQDTSRYLLEIYLEDLERSLEEDQYYWLLAIQTAREDRPLKIREK